MTTLVDPVQDVEFATLEQDIQSEINLSQQEQNLQDNTTPKSVEKPDYIKDKFWTGDIEESLRKQAEAYGSLESSYGRMANDLGQQRQLTDRLLDLKRADDLGLPQEQSNKPALTTIDSAALLDNPTESLTSFFDSRLSESTQNLQSKVDQIEAYLAQQNFQSRHPDYMKDANDPRFSDFVQKSQYRQTLAQKAINGDYNAAEELFTAWEEIKTQTPNTPTSGDNNTQTTDLNGAKEASLESNKSSGKELGDGGKIYSRAALMEMRLKNPERYADPAFQAVIMQAYREGRVK